MFATTCALRFDWDVPGLLATLEDDHALALCMVAVEAVELAKDSAPRDTDGFMDSIRVAAVGYEGPDDALYNRYAPWNARGSWFPPFDAAELLGLVTREANGDLRVWFGSFIRYAWYAEVGFHTAKETITTSNQRDASGARITTSFTTGGTWHEGSHVIMAAGDAVMNGAEWGRAFARVAASKRGLRFLERAAGDD